MLTLTFEWLSIERNAHYDGVVAPSNRDQPNHVKQPNPDLLIHACFKTDPPDKGWPGLEDLFFSHEK